MSLGLEVLFCAEAPKAKKAARDEAVSAGQALPGGPGVGPMAALRRVGPRAAGGRGNRTFTMVRRRTR